MSQTESTPTGDAADGIRADIEQTRAELADTVDALTDKLNVKARAGDKVAEAKAKVSDAAAQARPYRVQIGVAALAGVVVLVVVRRLRG